MKLKYRKVEFLVKKIKEKTKKYICNDKKKTIKRSLKQKREKQRVKMRKRNIKTKNLYKKRDKQQNK